MWGVWLIKTHFFMLLCMARHMTLFEFMNQHIQSLAADNSWCRFGHAMEEHTKLSQVLKAVGHDTTELDNAMQSVLSVVQTLKQATNKAKLKFTQEGVKHTTAVDEERLE